MASRSEARKQKSGDIPIADVEPFKDWLRSSGGRRAEGKGAYARGDFVGAVASFTLCLRRIDCDDACMLSPGGLPLPPSVASKDARALLEPGAR